MKVSIAAGDVFLVPAKDGDRTSFTRWDVLDINNGDIPLVCVEPTWRGSSIWMKAEDFQNLKPVKYGRIEERRNWWGFGTKRVLVRE